MPAGKPYKKPKSPFMLRVSSHDSIFQSSSTTSFAEEVANALCTRAKSLGSSHPSVITGKQQKLMKGLMDVAEEIRKEVPKTHEKQIFSTPTKSGFSVENLEALTTNNHNSEKAETENNISISIPVAINTTVQDGEAKQSICNILMDTRNQNISLGCLKNQVKGDTPNTKYGVSVERPGISGHRDITNEPASIHFRLAADYSAYSDSSWFSNYTTQSEDISRMPSRHPKIHYRTKKPRKQRSESDDDESYHLYSFIANDEPKKKKKSKNKRKLRVRILSIMNHGNMRSLRKRFRGAWCTTRKAVENTFAQLKNSILKSSKK